MAGIGGMNYHTQPSTSISLEQYFAIFLNLSVSCDLQLDILALSVLSKCSFRKSSLILKGVNCAIPEN
jgi:hypothetical protein